MAEARVSLQRTWRRPGVWWCREYACQPSALPSGPVRLGFGETFKAEFAQRCFLRVSDAGLDLALPIGMSDATRQGDSAIVGPHIPVERVQRGS